jgi:mercuric ion binding protein
MLKQFIFIAIITMTCLITLPSLAAEVAASHSNVSLEHKKMMIKTVTLSVPGMTCRVCPITVKKALENVKGVSKVSVNFDAKTATVTFNPNQANVSDLTEATKKSGYPSSIKNNAK